MAIAKDILNQQDLSGGLNTTQGPFDLPANSWQVIENCDFDFPNANQKRRGFSNIAKPVTSKRVVGLHEFVPTVGAKQFLQVSGTEIFKLSAFTWTSVKSGLTEDKLTSFQEFRKELFILNGSDNVIRYDGTTFRDAGIAAPLTAASLADGGVGSLTGTFKYKITFIDVDTDRESNAGPASSEITITNKQIDLSSIPTSGTNLRRIYRTLSATNDQDIYFFVKELNDTDTTFTDNVVDALVGISGELSDINEIPPKAKFAVSADNRFFLAGINGEDETLYISDLNNPEAYSKDRLTIFTRNNEPITGLGVIFNEVVVFTENSIQMLRGTAPENFRLDVVTRKIGTLAHFSIVSSENFIYFFGKRNIWRFDGQNFIRVSANIEQFIEDNLNLSQEGNLSGVFHDGKYYLSYNGSQTITTPPQRNDRTLVFYERRQNQPWTDWSRGGQYLSIRSDLLHAGSGLDDGKVFELNKFFNDEGLADEVDVSGITFSLSAGSLTGDYLYSFTFIDSNTGNESNGAPTLIPLGLASEQITLLTIPSGPTSNIHRRIYRTVASGTEFKLLGSIPDQSTTTFTDNVLDSSLGADIIDHAILMSAQTKDFDMEKPSNIKCFMEARFKADIDKGNVFIDIFIDRVLQETLSINTTATNIWDTNNWGDDATELIWTDFSIVNTATRLNRFDCGKTISLKFRQTGVNERFRLFDYQIVFRQKRFKFQRGFLPWWVFLGDVLAEGARRAGEGLQGLGMGMARGSPSLNPSRTFMSRFLPSWTTNPSARLPIVKNVMGILTKQAQKTQEYLPKECENHGKKKPQILKDKPFWNMKGIFTQGI